MRRLTVNKLVNMSVALPNRDRMIGDGNTSIVYTTSDPKRVQMFTIEEAKFQWWEYSGLIESYEQVGEAFYSGINHRASMYVRQEYLHYKLPVFMAFPRRVTFDFTRRRSLRLHREMTAAGDLWSRNMASWRVGVGECRSNFWTALTYCGYYPLAEVAEFVSNALDSQHIMLDLQRKNFAMYNDRVFALDVFAHERTVIARQLA